MRSTMLVSFVAIAGAAYGRTAVSGSFRGGTGVRGIQRFSGGLRGTRHGGTRAGALHHRGGHTRGIHGRGGVVHGVRGRGGLDLHYTKRTSHSKLDIHFSSGSWYRSGASSYGFYGGSYYGTSVSGSGLGGVVVERGWYPYSPYLYRQYRPPTATGPVGPFSYVDGVHFQGSPAAAAFEQARRSPADALRQAAGPVAAEAARGKPPTARDLVDVGDELFGRGELTLAVATYRKAVEAAPDDPMPAFALGHGLLALGDYKAAAAELRRALKLFPDMVHVEMNLGDFYGDRRLFEAHLARLSRFVALMPDDRAARFLLGYACYFTQQHAKARDQLQALGGDDPEAQLLLRTIRPPRR